MTNNSAAKPTLYPSVENFERVQRYKHSVYVCLAPTSVWFTKQFPKEKWVALCDKFPTTLIVYLLGAPSDAKACNWIEKQSINKNIVNLAGELNFLESAALMKDAQMNYVNDSAPMHMASAVNAATTAIFCSTVPSFGFGPLADRSKIVETKLSLACRPCGLHGHHKCPYGHFQCAFSIDLEELLATLP